MFSPAKNWGHHMICQCVPYTLGDIKQQFDGRYAIYIGFLHIFPKELNTGCPNLWPSNDVENENNHRR